MIIAGAAAEGQCIDSPTGTTGVVFNNASSYQITFYIDWIEMQTLVSHTVSKVIPIPSGTHLLSARAVTTDSNELWVFSENDFPPGKIYTWTVTVTDTDSDSQTNNKWRGRLL